MNKYTDEQLREAVNEDTPQAAMLICLNLFQRLVVSLETLAAQNTPGNQTLFGEVTAQSEKSA